MSASQANPLVNLVLKQTPLFQAHKSQGGKLIDFGGWEMPVQYSGVIQEHNAVRNHVGLFDVSHMGEIQVSGRGSVEYLNGLTLNDVAALKVGQAQYSAICLPTGKVIDDIVIYRRGHDSFFICVNASNAAKDFAWLEENLPKQGVQLENVSDFYGQIAIQGPKSRELLQAFCDTQIQDLPYYHFVEAKILGAPSIVARTGYTGELGFEIYIPSNLTVKIWNSLREGKDGIKPELCGLGARDTLRLEMGYLLYGNDMDETTSALECGLSWITKFQKPQFMGREALLQEKKAGSSRKLVGFELLDKGIARHGFAIYDSVESAQSMGCVTSGTHSPSLKKSIGLAYLPANMASLDTPFWVDIRGDRKAARVTKKPFYTQGTAQK